MRIPMILKIREGGGRGYLPQAVRWLIIAAGWPTIAIFWQLWGQFSSHSV